MKDRIFTILISVISTFGLMKLAPESAGEHHDVLSVDRLIVRKELIVSDTGEPWEKGFEAQQIARGIYARSVTKDSVGGLWVRSRLIKGEIDDPFDDRFHALERDGTLRRAPGHISWNVWLGDNWRQLAILQGEALEFSEVPPEEWSGSNHPGRIRFQSFRPGHGEPLSDAVIGQGMMSIGGGGYGGGGLPYATDTLELWGGSLRQNGVAVPGAPRVSSDDGSGAREYSIVALDARGNRTAASPPAKAWARATGACRPRRRGCTASPNASSSGARSRAWRTRWISGRTSTPTRCATC